MISTHLFLLLLLLLHAQKMADQAQLDADLQAFSDALGRIGLGAEGRNAIIALTGCRNITMLGILSAAVISRTGKVLRIHVVNPLPITQVQE